MRLLNAQEMADFIGVKQSTIYQWTHQDYIPHVKLGKLVRFKVEDIEKWLKKNSCGGRVQRRINVEDLGI